MFKHLSSTLLLAIMALIGVGLVQVYSSSYVFATESYGDGLFFFKRQFVFAIFSLIVLLTISVFPIKVIEKWGWLTWIISLLALTATFIPGAGVKVGGANRWLQLPIGIRFEPSEILKVSFILLIATLITRKDNWLGKVKPGWLFILISIPFFLLLKQPDFGSFAILIFTGVLLLFSFGLKWRYILGSVAIILPTFYYLVMMRDYRKARMLAFLDPWSDPEQKGFQMLQSMMSFSSGGLTGMGLGQGQGKLFFLPEAHTDFTMAVLGEEMGYVGFVLVMGLYAFVILRGLQIAIKCENKFYRATAIGISTLFGLSIFINVGVVIGLLPTKGLTLPFLSYGGSSLVALCFMFGILLNIERNIKFKDQFSFHKQKTSLKF